MTYDVGCAGVGEGGRQEAVTKRLVAERRWRLAMHSQSHPSSIMRDVLTCLQHNQVSWKKQAPYNLKCRKAVGLLGNLHSFELVWDAVAVHSLLL